ncbi:MAG: hypothetical protein ACXWZ1_01775, partial [Gaiellaceae bacterium]
MSAIAELSEERVVEGVYAVARKQRLRTKGGAPYLALELVDPSGRIDAGGGPVGELVVARVAEGGAGRVWAFVKHHLLTVYSLLAFVYLMLPIGIVIAFSFNNPKGRFNYVW